jgi:hypothetical protein
MTAVAWALDQSAKVPNLFVDVTDFEAAKAAMEAKTGDHMLSVVEN